MVTMTSEVDKAQSTLIMSSKTTISNTPVNNPTTCDVSHLEETTAELPTQDSPLENNITTSVNIEVHVDDAIKEETSATALEASTTSSAKASSAAIDGIETIIAENTRNYSSTPINSTSSNTLAHSKDNLMTSTTNTTESVVQLDTTDNAHSLTSESKISLAKPLQPTTKHLTNVNQLATNKQYNKNEDTPNVLVYKKMEAIIERMQAEGGGVPVRTVKGFMTKVPSVFTGADLIVWILKNSDITDVTEALHFAHLLASHGYIFPIDDHILTVKNDNTFYRFQTPYFWPSNFWEPENTDYAVYLCKRTMQNKTRLELADYEAENLAKLQKMFSRKWEFIFMQAESQSKVAKKRDKLERKVLDSQERAFWDVHRPMPGCVNTTEIDIKKAYRRGASSHGTGSAGAAIMKHPAELLTRIICLRKQKLDHRTIKMSKAAEGLVSYYEQYNEFDYFLTPPEIPNPWQTDSTEMWDAEKNSKEVPLRNVKRWGFSMRELLKDPVGREQFAKFLEKEYSAENILFWEAVKEMKALPQSGIKVAIQRIWKEFLAPDSPRAVNVDSKSIDLAREAVNSAQPNRWCFDVAAAHIYHLMETDSYARYLRSDMYKDYLNCSRKKIKSIPNLFGVKR